MWYIENKDIYIDMLTDSGVNAMSDRQTAAMHLADDSYAGSQTFARLKAALKEVFGTDNVLPAHQGRAYENILAESFVKPGMVAIMNFHFTTTKAHVTRCGGEVVEVLHKKGLILQSDDPFKGDMDLQELRRVIEEYIPEKVAYVRVEAGTNLIGGQPVSFENMLAVADICHEYGVPSVLDASLLQDNIYFMKTREAQCKYMTPKEIYHLLVQDLRQLVLGIMQILHITLIGSSFSTSTRSSLNISLIRYRKSIKILIPCSKCVKKSKIWLGLCKIMCKT